MREQDQQIFKQPYAEIERLSTDAALRLRQECKQFGEAFRPIYAGFSEQLQHDGALWRGPKNSHLTFYKNLLAATSTISQKNVDEVALKIRSTPSITRDWRLLGGFLEHDLAHLKPTYLFKPFLDEMSIVWNRQNACILQDEDKLSFDRVASRIEELTALQALPLDFVSSVARTEQGKRVPSQNMKPLDLMEQIAMRIKARFAIDDYVITGDKSTHSVIKNRNLITISGDDITLNANESMLFAVLYNLAKNAAKANSNQLTTTSSRPLRHRYGFAESAGRQQQISLEVEQTENNILFQIGDSGEGISLDQSLKGVHAQMARLVDNSKPEEIGSSEVYKRIATILGEEQTGHLFAWPTNPHAIRGLTVGSLFDLRFLAGFSGDTWNLESLTSGMGLWGVKYITEQLGGTVMGTIRFQGGTLFSVIIPRENVMALAA